LLPLRLYPLRALACRSFGHSAGRNAAPDGTEHPVTRRVAGHPTDERALDASFGLRRFNSRAGDQGADENCGDKYGSHVLFFWLARAGA
jgi:hypothetical protein